MPISNPPPSVEPVVGTYTGDAAATQHISTGFKCSLVFIQYQTNGWGAILMENAGVAHGATTPHLAATDSSLHATDGFTVTNTAITPLGGNSLNSGAMVWKYVAFRS